MKPGMIIVNGQACASVDALDRGLHYGDGVFRTIRASEGRLAWWDDHYRKLAHDCAALRLPCPEEALLREEAGRIAAMPDIGVVKIVVTRGAGQRGYGIPVDAAPTRVLMAFPAPVQRQCELRVRWCELRLSAQPKLAGIKHLNRLENVLARSEWDDPDIGEGLLLDQEEQVICGTMSNLFLLENGGLVTPALDRCGIAGVARERLMRAAARHGTPVRVEPVSRARLLESGQVMLTSSLIGVRRVSALGERTWQDSGVLTELVNWLDEED